MTEPARRNPRGAAYSAKHQDKHWIARGKALKLARKAVKNNYSDEPKRRRQARVMEHAKIMGQCLLNAERRGHSIMIHYHGIPS